MVEPINVNFMEKLSHQWTEKNDGHIDVYLSLEEYVDRLIKTALLSETTTVATLYR